MSKFYEPNVQTLVEDNKNIFEADSDAVIEALVTLRNNDMSTMHSYDAIYDQENEDLLSQIQDNSNDEESFNNQPSPYGSSVYFKYISSILNMNFQVNKYS